MMTACLSCVRLKYLGAGVMAPSRPPPRQTISTFAPLLSSFRRNFFMTPHPPSITPLQAPFTFTLPPPHPSSPPPPASLKILILHLWLFMNIHDKKALGLFSEVLRDSSKPMIRIAGQENNFCKRLSKTLFLYKVIEGHLWMNEALKHRTPKNANIYLYTFLFQC